MSYEPSPWQPIADHVDRYLATDGVDGFEWEGAQCVILTTVGRKTGSLRRTPLIRIRDGQRYLLVASMGGAPRHPNWYLNLVGQSRCDRPGPGRAPPAPGPHGHTAGEGRACGPSR